MKLKQISIFLENEPGRLYTVTDSLGKAGINLRALSLVDTADFGVLRLLVSDITLARQMVMKMGLPARIDDVIAVEIEDRPRALAKLLRPIFDAKINVNYMYAYAKSSKDRAVMIFNLSDNDRALVILNQNGFKALGPESFGIIDSEK